MRPGFQTLLEWDAIGRWVGSWAARLRLAPGIVYRPQTRKSPALRTDGAGPRGLRHARHCVGGFVPAACTKGSLGGCAEAPDSGRVLLLHVPKFVGFKFFQRQVLEKRRGTYVRSCRLLVHSRIWILKTPLVCGSDIHQSSINFLNLLVSKLWFRGHLRTWKSSSACSASP